MEFKDFSRTSPNIQGLFKTVRTLFPYNFTLDNSNHVLSVWQIQKKNLSTAVQYTEFI